MSRASSIRQLKASPRQRMPRHWDPEEVREIIAAYQRGVSITTIGEVFGINADRAPRVLRDAIAAWALRHCECHKAKS